MILQFFGLEWPLYHSYKNPPVKGVKENIDKNVLLFKVNFGFQF